METVDCVVIGAGVVGLACAKSLAEAGREVIVLERETAFGTGISSRNSEVIHAGLYYPPGSLKARLCVAGRDALYAYCAERGVAHARCGKLVVAPKVEQAEGLQLIRSKAAANGVHDLQLLDRRQIAALEPALDAHAALLSPSTGIVDSHGLMLALLGDAERHGAMLALGSPVEDGRPDGDGVVLRVGGEQEMDLRARWVINAAGLDAVALGHRLGGPAEAQLPQAWFARGVYFTLTGKAPFSRLIYPLPEPGGLGVHLTLDLGGQAKFGPDVEWIDQPDYHVDPARAEAFYTAIRSWWPQLEDGRLEPGYAGVRPKIVGPGMPDADFRIDGPAQHGTPGLIHLLGIESPGLTAALAIGQQVAGMVAA
ncbi:NAD(P)/FAD-dependent oxidoreductase [Denitromonas iodatirespirans]|uniref:NAD(P)/FAD-dependent oxidoreductase n=1 Tax=Denitromonas iodatirespirans TaxID=2795389 RepID=A0A944D9Q7_DENI1|nr:NAD(P)/FAD-dependent oxidoreductase [Denitromonas iodatirespirans]MBT0961317.1 NAD(P)/FAD-dependent oxidoreductase [Denitromonas iodatirespirans]